MVRPIGKFQIINTYKEFSISIENNGLGPLIIKSVIFDRFEDKQCKSIITVVWPPNHLKKPGDHLELCKLRLNINNFVIYPGKSIYLAQCTILDQNDTQQKEDLQAIKDDYGLIFEIRLEFTDIYGKKTWLEESRTIIIDH
jgi:hypothetical protein